MAGAASVSVQVTSKLQATVVSNDVGPSGAFNASQKSRVLSGWDVDFKLDGTTTPKGEQAIYTQVTLVSNAATLDLTNILQVDGNTYDATGKRVVGYRIQNPGNNVVNVAPGASNPYPLKGAGNDFDVLPYDEDRSHPFQVGKAPARPAVSSTVKTIDFAGTGSDIFRVSLIFGS